MKRFNVGNDMMGFALESKLPVLQCVVVNGLEGARVEKKKTNLGKKIVSVKIFRLKYLQFGMRKTELRISSV